VKATFPVEAARRWQSQARSLLTSFPPYTLLHVTEIEFRISDCFTPPTVELWLHSFDIVGGLDKSCSLSLQKVGGSKEVSRLLDLYTERREECRMAAKVFPITSSPLRSQLEAERSEQSCNEDSMDERRTVAVSQQFYTQISQVSPRPKRQPLALSQPRTTPGTPLNPDTFRHHSMSAMSSIFEESSRKAADHRNTTAVPPAAEGNLEPAEQYRTQKLPGYQSVVGSVGTSRRSADSMSPEASPWPGGKTPLTSGRYLPRYLTKIPKEQQAILEADIAWQPSRADRHIQGSIPNGVLSEFTAEADKAAQNLRRTQNTRNGTPRAEKETNQSISQENLGEEEDSDAALTSSESEASEHSWSATLPPDSSPPSVPEKGITTHIAQNRQIRAPGPGASDGDRTLVDQPPKYVREEVIFRDTRRASSNVSLPCSPAESAVMQDTRDKGTSGFNTKHRSQVSQPDRPTRSARSREEMQHIEMASQLSQHVNEIEEVVTQPPDTRIPQTQRVVRDFLSGDQVVIQVQRTPFAPQLPIAKMRKENVHLQAHIPNTISAHLFDSTQESKSSPSVVHGTFSNAQAEQGSKSEITTRNPAYLESGASEDEQIIDEDCGKTNDTSDPQGVAEVNSETLPPEASHSLAGLQEKTPQQRQAKRKELSDTISPAKKPGSFPKDGPPNPSPEQSKRRRLTSNFASLDALRHLQTARPASEVARESRRAFFRTQQRPGNENPPLPQPILSDNQAATSAPLPSPRLSSHGPSDAVQSRFATPRTNPWSNTGSKSDYRKGIASHLPVGKQSMYDEYKAAYPDYQGDILHFHKACKYIKLLHAQSRAPHPSLWDDFIFCRHHDYPTYLREMAEASEDAMPYFQFYTQYVELPVRMKLVVRPKYILSLATDSAIGSSVLSAMVTAPVTAKAPASLERSVAASSSASNVMRSQVLQSPEMANNHESAEDLKEKLSSQDEDKPRQTQESSIKQWVEQQSLGKALGAESPELGSAEASVEEEDIPDQVLDDSTERQISPPPTRRPAIPGKVKQKTQWCDDPHTPFKSFAKSYTALASERRNLKESVGISDNGCVQPRLQSVIDIFSFYR
jgi:hypothetical protein